MEKFKAFLLNDIDFNIEIYNVIQDLKDKKFQKIDLSQISIPCKLKIDIILLNDQDLDLSNYIQTNYPNLDEIIREYVGGVLEKEQSLKNSCVKSEQVLPQIEIINGNFTSSLSIYAQQNILQNSLKQGYMIQGQLVLLDYFQVLKVYPVENYFSLRRYSYKCRCFSESRMTNKNLILHIIENKFYNHLNNQSSFVQKAPCCDQCNYELYEEKDKSKIELCQKTLVYIPQNQELIIKSDGQLSNQFNQKDGKLCEMYIEKQYCNQLKVNQTYSCIAYYAVAANQKQSKSILLTGYKQLEISEQLFACTISTSLKDMNIHFNKQMINQVSLFNNISDNINESIQSQNKFNSNQDDNNFHFRFKQMMFGVDSFFNELGMIKFSFLHLKTALVLSYVLNNSKSILAKPGQQYQHFEQLNILFQCESSFMQNIIESITNTFKSLQNFHVFDCLLQSDLISALIKSNNGILLIKNLQDISKQHSEILQNILQNQEIYVNQLKIKLNLKSTIWGFYTIMQSSNKTKNFKNNKFTSSIHTFQQIFDVSLQHDKSILSIKDYSISLQNEAEMYLKKELQKYNKNIKRNDHELSTAKKSRLSKMNAFTEEVSTMKKLKENINQPFINKQEIEQSEEQAYELLNGFINTVRNNSSTQDSIYSTNNIASLSKFAIASSLFQNVFISQNSPGQFQVTDKQGGNLRVVIDIFDAFLSVFFNILSRKIFSRDLDTKYFISFILNYGVGYIENQDRIIPQEKEFFIALEKIQDQIIEFINF